MGMVEAAAAWDGTPTADATLSLLREQDVLYARLEALADRQHCLIADDDPGRLMSVLSERERVATGLSRIADRLGPMRGDWATHRNGLSESQRHEADQLVARTRGRLARLMAGDERDARLLSARAQRIGSELRTNYCGGQAIQAYRAAPQPCGPPTRTGMEHHA